MNHFWNNLTDGLRPAAIGWSTLGLSQILANLNAILTTIALLLTIAVTTYGIVQKIRKGSKNEEKTESHN